MSEIEIAVEKYISLRQSLGCKFHNQGRLLRQFIKYADERGAGYVTIDLALRWTKQSKAQEPSTLAVRLGVIRGFASWRHVTDPRTEIPPKNLLLNRYHRKPPYIYSDAEIENLLQACHNLPSSTGLRGLTYSTVFGLISVTGMRGTEAYALDRQDVDLDEMMLTIRLTKFRKSRLILLHQSTRDALKVYASRRDQIIRRPTNAAFFVSEKGVRLSKRAAAYNFAKVSQKVGLREPGKGNGRGPRIHDMRHRFACQTLVDWYRAGLNVEREMPKLSAYLGHARVNDTYWYLEAVPELLELATLRLEQSARGTRS